MRLNVQTDYALRLLSQLAANGDRLVTISEVAARFGISRNHLMKVAQLLGQHGFVTAVRGRSGGLRLATPPEGVRLGDVVRCMENDFALVECLGPEGGDCLIVPACRLKGVLADATAAFLAVLDRHTLADLTRGNTALASLLTEEAA